MSAEANSSYTDKCCLVLLLAASYFAPSKHISQENEERSEKRLLVSATDGTVFQSSCEERRRPLPTTSNDAVQMLISFATSRTFRSC